MNFFGKKKKELPPPPPVNNNGKLFTKINTRQDAEAKIKPASQEG